MSVEEFKASKPLMRLLVENQVVFMYQYFAEPRHLVLEVANLVEEANHQSRHS